MSIVSPGVLFNAGDIVFVFTNSFGGEDVFVWYGNGGRFVDNGEDILTGPFLKKGQYDKIAKAMEIRRDKRGCSSGK